MSSSEAVLPEIDLENPPFALTAIDRKLLVMRDEDFHRITWPELETIIASNTLEQLKRLPSDLRRYLAWSHDIKSRYGGITPFVVQERLRWEPLTPSTATIPNPDSTTNPNGDPAGQIQGLQLTTAPPLFAHISTIPFSDPADYAVLLNDWPYGLAKGITHLVVWSKTPIAVDEIRGDVTPESKAQIEAFIESYFIKSIVETSSSTSHEEPNADKAEGAAQEGARKVLWFKNWVSLQSVRGVDHVHVLVRDIPPELLVKWTVRRDI